MELHYNLTREFMSAEFVRTGERPNVHRAVQVDPKTLNETQRAMLEILIPSQGSSRVLVNPDQPGYGGSLSCAFDRYLKPADVPAILDQLAVARLSAKPELTQPITFRIHAATLDRVRAYQREHGLKTDGETLRELIEAGLAASSLV